MSSKILGFNGFDPSRWFILCLVTALFLVIAMSLYSAFDNHPDELHHFKAAQYYTRHFFPPEIGDPRVRDTYSVWGVSYLNYQWIEYFLAGKFMWLISPFGSDDTLSARFYQVFLLLLLAAFFVIKWRFDPAAAVMACFLLVSPQLWYVFSYVNNDAFALFVSVLLAYQMAGKNTLFRQFLDSGRVREGLLGGITFGLGAGILFTCKTNYWVFLGFAACWMLVTFPISLTAFKKYVLVLLIALSFVGFRITLDLYVNGETNFVGLSYINYFLGDFEKGRGKLLEYQDEVADPKYKPSVIEKDLSSTPPDVKMAAKGVPFSDVIFRMGWLRTSFFSSIGVYGYMSIFASPAYYKLMAVIYLAFVLYVIYALAKSRDRLSIRQLIVTTLFCTLSIFISAYLSWTYALQAQGRYLFPVFAMTAVLLATNRRHFNNLILSAMTVAAFLLSIYSFVFVGLAEINNH